METAGPFSAVSLKQLTAPEQRQGRLQDPSLQCQPRHLVLAVSSKIKVMCHSCIFIVFLIQCILSHLQHNIIECMRGVYVLIKHSS